MNKTPKHKKEITNRQKTKECNSCKGTGKKNKFIGQMSCNGYRLVNIPGFIGYAQVVGGMIKVQCAVCNGTGNIISLDIQEKKKKG